MSSISVRGVSKAFPGRVLFENLDLDLREGHRTVLIGENGVGKTTLLRIFAGVELPDSGQVFADEWISREYISQEFDLAENQVAYEFLEGSSNLKRTLQILASLGFDTSNESERLWLTLDKLSSGQKKMLMLARSFADHHAHVILDEPENHLDIFSREKLAELLLHHQGGVLMVSHDHYLINRVADQIVELEDEKLRAFSGTYEDYLGERERQIQSREREWVAREQQIRRLHQTVMRMRETAKMNSDTASAYQAKRRQLDKLKEDHGRRPTSDREHVRLLVKSQDRKASKRMLILDQLTVGYESAALIANIHQEIVFGEKVALVGPNGCGKSTLLRTINGETPLLTGIFRLGTGVKTAYFGQDHDVDLDQSGTPLELMQEATGLLEGSCRSRLSRLLFETSDMTRTVRTLSGGQKSRLKFGLILAKDPDLLILDEPTNHLDTTTWSVLVELLDGWNGTVLFSSHDRIFIDSVATKLWVVEDGKIRECLDTLTQYLEERHVPKKSETNKARRGRRK